MLLVKFTWSNMLPIELVNEIAPPLSVLKKFAIILLKIFVGVVEAIKNDLIYGF